MPPQRLPVVNADDGTWGNIIRQYLMKEHYNDDTNNAANGGHHKITVRAGTAAAGTAPLKFTTGTLLTTPEAGAIEFNGDNLYFTQTTGPTRKRLATYDETGGTGDIYYRNSSGYFTRLAAGSAGDFLTIASGIPSWTATIVSKAIGITNTVTVLDTNFTVQDNTDNTKQLKFELSGLGTNTTSTLTVPNSSGTMYITGGTDVSVADGGTGRSTNTTAYGIIAAGTTATGAMQTIAPGTAGHFLRSAGGSALASFAAISIADMTGTTAQFNTALTDGDFATQAGTETLSAKTLTAPRIVNNGFIADANGNELIVAGTTASAVNEIKVTNAATGAGPTIAAQGGDANVDLNINIKGTGHVNVNSELDMTNHRVMNVLWPTVDSDAATKGYVDYSSVPIADNGVLYRPTGTSLNTVSPESWQFTHMPHLFNDIAYNNIRGGSVIFRRNGATIIPGSEENLFTPDTLACTLEIVNASDIFQIEVTMCRGFDWTSQFGLVQHPSYRAKDIIIERYNTVTALWTTIESATDQLSGVYRTMASGWGGSNSVTKLRFTLSDFTIPAGEYLRVTNVFALSYDSSLLSGSFLPLGGGTMYGQISNTTNPTSADHLARKGYIDTGLAAKANTSHTHTASQVSDSSAVGRSVLAAADAAAARTAIGAGTGNGDVTISGTQTLTNKTLDTTTQLTIFDANLTLQDEVDPTKTVKLTLDLLSTGRAINLRVPNVASGNHTLVTLNSAATLQSKTMSGLDNTFSDIPVSALGTGRVTGSNNGTAANLTLWKGTNAQYVALGTYDANTIYVVTT